MCVHGTLTAIAAAVAGAGAGTGTETETFLLAGGLLFALFRISRLALN